MADLITADVITAGLITAGLITAGPRRVVGRRHVWFTPGVIDRERLVRRLHVDLLRVATAACRAAG